MNRTTNKTMKTVAIDRFGGLNEMKIRELPVPELDANEILVRVEAHAASASQDLFRAEGGFAKSLTCPPNSQSFSAQMVRELSGPSVKK